MQPFSKTSGSFLLEQEIKILSLNNKSNHEKNLPLCFVYNLFGMDAANRVL